jgi:hypothetical protein
MAQYRSTPSRPIATRSLRAAAMAIALLGLTGCAGSDLARTFGLTRDVPNEFEVTTRAPLSMPPELTLPPPQPGAPRPQERTAAATAETDLVPQSALAPAVGGANSPGQQALVNAAGPPAPSDIRGKVDAQAAKDLAAGRSFTDHLMFWKNPPLPGVVIDPALEAQRLRNDAALGQSDTEGGTPIIQPPQQNFIRRLF